MGYYEIPRRDCHNNPPQLPADLNQLMDNTEYLKEKIEKLEHYNNNAGSEMRIKIIVTYGMKELQGDVNYFLSDIKGALKDIKYCICYDPDRTQIRHTAMIIYDE